MWLWDLLISVTSTREDNIMTEWKEYTGSDGQIAEIKNAKDGFVCRNSETDSGILSIKYGQLFSDQSEYPILNAMWKGSLKLFIDTNNTTHYLICNPHPYADMICQWARTCQPVYVKTPARIWPEHAYIGDDLGGSYCTTEPNWNIPGAEYRFTPFDEEVCK